MFSNMCLRALLYLALAVCINGWILKDPKNSASLFSEAVTQHVELKQENIDMLKDNLPTIENRVAVRSSACPFGYERVGVFCIPSDYD